MRLIRRMLGLSTLYRSNDFDFVDLERHHKVHTHLVAILRGVVAIAEQSEEKLRLASLETLGELGEFVVSLFFFSEISSLSKAQ